MKQNNLERSKNIIGKKYSNGRIIIIAILIAGVFAVLTETPLTRTQLASTGSIAVPAATPLLDKEMADALVQELGDALAESIDDEEAIASIQAKWGARIVANRTRAQILAALFADVRSVITDAETQNAIWESWKEIGKETEVEEPQPEPAPAEPVPPPRAPVAPPRAAPNEPAPGILDDTRKANLAAGEMATYRSHTANIKFVKETGNYRGQWYAIYKDNADPDLQVKVAAVHLAVKTIIDRGVKLPYDLRVFCTSKYEAQNRAYPRGDKWVPTAWVVLRWGLAGGPALGSVSQMNFPGFNRPTITAIHEIGHILHERSAGDVLYFGRGSMVVDGKAAAAAKVSEYAKNSKKEFVAEVFAGMILGKQWPADVLAEYATYRGPRVP